MNIPVFDFHCDTALVMLGDDLNSAGSLAHNSGHIDLDRASALAGYAQCFACFTTSIPEFMNGLSPIVVKPEQDLHCLFPRRNRKKPGERHHVSCSDAGRNCRY